jgi:signal transduction histidine kinase
MASAAIGVRDAAIPTELTSSVAWSRAAVIVGMFALLVAGRTLAHLPIRLGAIVAIALAASFYNAILAAVAWRVQRRGAPDADRIRAWILYVGGFLDTVALALVVLFTGGLLSPWLYGFLAAGIVSSAVLPPTPGRVLTTLNAAAALLVVALPLFGGLPVAAVLLEPGFWSQPGYVAVVGLSLVGLMVLTAHAVRVPVETARAAARFQEGLAQIGVTLQRAEAGVEQVLAAVCVHAHHWFNADRTLILLLEGEELVVKAAEGVDTAGLLGRRIPVSHAASLEVEVLRRRRGFYVNHLQKNSPGRQSMLANGNDQAVLLVPLLGSLGVVGVLGLADRRRAARFTATLLQRAGILAAQAGVAVENARLLERVREEAESVAGLLRASERLTKSDDLHALLTDLNRIAAEMAGCDRSVIFLWDEGREVFRFGSASGIPPAVAGALRECELARGAVPLLDRAVAGETCVITAEQAAAHFPAEIKHAFRLGASAIVPLRTDRALQGVMTVSHLDPIRDFTAEQLWMLRGIARHAALAIERTRLVDDLRQANRLKSDFLSTVSHELRTPLNAIIGYTDLLRERTLGPLQPEQIEAADIVARKGQQLLGLINTTLDLTQLEAGQVHVQVSAFALRDVLAEIEQELAGEVPPMVGFTCAAASDVPELHTDRAKLKTVIKNLVHNALKFTARGRVEVRAGRAPEPDEVEVTVADTGIGIAAENVSAIFEMFRQLEPALTRHFGGVGLGLYIARRLLQLIGGRIQVRSELQRGSVFTVTLPVSLR